jgi:hypothetical protein
MSPLYCSAGAVAVWQTICWIKEAGKIQRFERPALHRWCVDECEMQFAMPHNPFTTFLSPIAPRAQKTANPGIKLAQSSGVRRKIARTLQN